MKRRKNKDKYIEIFNEDLPKQKPHSEYVKDYDNMVNAYNEEQRRLYEEHHLRWCDLKEKVEFGYSMFYYLVGTSAGIMAQALLFKLTGVI